MQVISLSGTYWRTASDSNYYYVISTSGMAVINKNNNQIEALGSTNWHLTDVWTEDTSSLVYISSSGAGVLSFDKGHISLQDITDKFSVKHHEPAITSNSVLCIDGNINGDLLVGTTSGVDFITTSGNIYSSEEFNPITAVHLLDSSKFLYSGDFGLACKVSETIGNWIEEDLAFILDEATLPAVTKLPIQDINAVESDDYITIALATSSGAEVINYRKGSTVSTSSVLQLFTRS